MYRYFLPMDWRFCHKNWRERNKRCNFHKTKKCNENLILMFQKVSNNSFCSYNNWNKFLWKTHPVNCGKSIEGLLRNICIYKTCPIKLKDSKFITIVYKPKFGKEESLQNIWKIMDIKLTEKKLILLNMPPSSEATLYYGKTCTFWELLTPLSMMFYKHTYIAKLLTSCC